MYCPYFLSTETEYEYKWCGNSYMRLAYNKCTGGELVWFLGGSVNILKSNKVSKERKQRLAKIQDSPFHCHLQRSKVESVNYKKIFREKI